MSIKKTIVISVLFHVLFFSAALLFSAGLFKGSGNSLDEKAFFVKLTIDNSTTDSHKFVLKKKTDASNQVTINAGDGSVLIDDATSHSDNAKNGYDQVVSDGTQYWIITHGH